MKNFMFVYFGLLRLSCIVYLRKDGKPEMVHRHTIYSILVLKILRNKKWQTEHRTATTAYPCYLPILGEFSRSWSCRLAGRKDKRYLELTMGENNFF